VRKGRRLVAALGAAAIGAIACSMPNPFARHPSPEELFEASRPAVAMVETDDDVTWSVPTPTLTAAKQQQLQSRLQAMVRSGQIGPSKAAIAQAEARLLSDDPGAWFTPSEPRHQQTDALLAIGSGFFVTEDGYLLTNAHVVQVSDATVRTMLLAALDQESGDATQVGAFRDEMSKSLGAPVTDAQARKLFQWVIGVSRADLRVVSTRITYRVGLGTMSPNDVKAKGQPAELVVRGEEVPGRDVAVLKVAGGPYPSLPVAASAPDEGAHLNVIGYPCRCADERQLDFGQPLAAVLTEGTVRAQMTMRDGWTATGTDAHIEHGNSGGPVLDDAGRVVGLATFVDPGAVGDGAQARSFAVPIEVARAFTDGAGVRPAQGRLGRLYAAAMAEFHERHYRAAEPLFQELVGADPRDPYAARYLAESQRAVAAGRDATPAVPIPPWAGPGLMVVAAVGGLAAAVVVVVLRRRRRVDIWSIPYS
jgi:serine protease Do